MRDMFGVELGNRRKDDLLGLPPMILTIESAL
jgi:hypothetical protein